jgi:hypothetical protein
VSGVVHRDPFGVGPELGELVGEGVSSEVYSWTTGKVVKLFRPPFRGLAAVEHQRARAVHDAGAPSPGVHELVEVGGRRGVVFDRLAGPDLLGERGAMDALALLHAAVHDLPAPDRPDLPELADTLASRGIEGMERGSSLFHGDFHPGNVLHHHGRLLVIDWSNGHRAPAAADVACSVLSIGYRGVHGADASRHVHERRVRAAERYLDTYSARRPAVARDVPTWIAVIGRLLLEQEPDLAFADELAARWLER